MEDQLLVMAYAKISIYWKDKIRSCFSPQTDNCILAMVSSALSDDITFPKNLLRYIVVIIARGNYPSLVGMCLA